MNTTLRALVNQAERLVRAEAYEEAIALCHAFLRRYPRYARGYRILAEAHLGLGEHGEAADLFRRALGVDPEDPVSYAGLGIIFAERGLREEAIWQLERAFELAPGRDGLRRELIRLYQERGSAGQVQLTRAALSRLYARGGLWNKAIGELQDLLAREPYRLDLRATLARTLWRARRRDEAAQAAQAILDQAPNCLVARLILGAYWCREGRIDEGRTLLLGAQELDPEHHEAARLLGAEWPALVEAAGLDAGSGAEAEPETEMPDATQHAAPPEPAQAHALPGWLEGGDEAPDASQHIVMLPEGRLQALLSNLAEQEAAVKGEAGLPFGQEVPLPDEAAATQPSGEEDVAPGPGEPEETGEQDVAPGPGEPEETGEQDVASSPAEPAAPPLGCDVPEFLAPVAVWQRRFDAAPDDHEARLGLARALVASGRLAEALPHYDALGSLAAFLDRVIGDLEAIAEADAQQRAARELLGDAYARSGRFQDAMDMYHWLLAHGSEIGG